MVILMWFHALGQTGDPLLGEGYSRTSDLLSFGLGFFRSQEESDTVNICF